MRLQLRWFLTQKLTPLEERDELLGPKTTVLEVKGLVQIMYTYPAKNMIMIAHRTLLENDTTLESIGIIDQAAADKEENVITVHVLSGDELEGDDDEENPKSATGSSVLEFKHEDFIKASKMLGHDVPVSTVRTSSVRADPPRARPVFLDAQPASTGKPPLSSAGESNAHRIFQNVWYGLRKEGVEKSFGFSYPGVAEPFDFWDLRLNHEGHTASVGELCMELFFFGEMTDIDPQKFHTLAVETMASRGFRVRPVGSIREAGCMYPLIAVPIIISESEALQLGDAVFERFGQQSAAHAPSQVSPQDRPAGNGKADCLVM